MDSPFTPGRVVDGKFRIERVLGTGGMGMVFGATHLQLDQPVAIKVMRPTDALDATALARFVREARAAAGLRGEHVVKVKDVGSFEGCPYIVMELLEGADLEQVLSARGPLPVAEAVGYILQACVGLAEAHAYGIIHRDLKPANMFVTRLPDGEPQLKLLDFGISKETASKSGLTQTAVAMGSPYYMSPEQLRSARGADARSDIWSLGAVLYELVTGRLPFRGDNLYDVSLAVTQDDPAPVDLPQLQGVIDRCLAKEPGLRYPTVAELADALVPVGPRGAWSLADRVRRTLDSSKPSISLPLPASPAADPPPRKPARAEAPPRKPARPALPLPPGTPSPGPGRPDMPTRPRPRRAAPPRPQGRRELRDSTQASTLRYRGRRPWAIVVIVGLLIIIAVALVVTWRPPAPRPAAAPPPSGR